MIRSPSCFLLAAAMLFGILQTGCEGRCDEPTPLVSGDYLISKQSYGAPEPDKEWLVGGLLHIDLEAEVAIIRYTREGTDYEVRFTLEP